MLSQTELAQVRHVAIREMAEIYKAVNVAPHGSYRYLIELGGVVCFAHQPSGRVLYHFNANDR